MERDSKEERRASVERQLDGTTAGNRGQTASPAEERPARDEETGSGAPDSPHGVGDSITTRAEDQARDERDRPDLGTKGPTERPVGTSTARDMTGVDPQAPPVPNAEDR
jgi:hypothetical protein